tara:strand:+ start:1944 stop:2879 length:936 start_codon:yes stop_codon:yes gene_type:complete
MTRARNTADILGSGATSAGVLTALTLEATGDTAASDNAAIGYTAAEGLVLTGQGSTGDVTIKNDADGLVAHVPTGTTGVTFAGTPTFPDGSIAIADLDIDGGTDIGAAIVDADLMIVDDAAGGTNRKATMTRLSTYMATKIGGGLVFIASSGAISDGTASVAFTQFDSTKYDNYAFYFQHVVPVTDQQILYGYHSADDGSSYDTTNGDYHYNDLTDATGFFVSYSGDGAGSDSGEYGVVGLAHLYAPHMAAFTVMSPIGIVTQTSGGGFYGQLTTSASARLAAEETNAIKFQFVSGNIESGEIVMYGIANA